MTVTYLALVGEGSYGQCWKCLDQQTGRTVALKCFKQDTTDKGHDKVIAWLALQEARMLRAVAGHPNIIRLHKVCSTRSGQVCLMTDFAEHNLHQELRSHAGGLPPVMLCLFSWQLLQGLAHMHARKVVHRDIKPSNVLLTHERVVQLCDFGFARAVHGPACCGEARGARYGSAVCACSGRQSYCQPPLSPYVVTRWYRPPELLLDSIAPPAAPPAAAAPKGTAPPPMARRSACFLEQSVDGAYSDNGCYLSAACCPFEEEQLAVDVWSFGCTLAELATGQVLFPGSSSLDQLHMIMRCLGQPPTPQQHAQDPAAGGGAPAQAAAAPSRLQQRIGAQLDPLLLEVLEACLCLDPKRRPRVADLLQMPYFSKVADQLEGTHLGNSYARYWQQQQQQPMSPVACGSSCASTPRAAAPAAWPPRAARSHSQMQLPAHREHMLRSAGSSVFATAPAACNRPSYGAGSMCRNNSGISSGCDATCSYTGQGMTMSGRSSIGSCNTQSAASELDTGGPTSPTNEACTPHAAVAPLRRTSPSLQVKPALPGRLAAASAGAAGAETPVLMAGSTAAGPPHAAAAAAMDATGAYAAATPAQPVRCGSREDALLAGTATTATCVPQSTLLVSTGVTSTSIPRQESMARRVPIRSVSAIDPSMLPLPAASAAARDSSAATAQGYDATAEANGRGASALLFASNALSDPLATMYRTQEDMDPDSAASFGGLKSPPPAAAPAGSTACAGNGSLGPVHSTRPAAAAAAAAAGVRPAGQERRTSAPAMGLRRVSSTNHLDRGSSASVLGCRGSGTMLLRTAPARASVRPSLDGVAGTAHCGAAPGSAGATGAALSGKPMMNWFKRLVMKLERRHPTARRAASSGYLSPCNHHHSGDGSPMSVEGLEAAGQGSTACSPGATPRARLMKARRSWLGGSTRGLIFPAGRSSGSSASGTPRAGECGTPQSCASARLSGGGGSSHGGSAFSPLLAWMRPLAMPF